MISRSVPQTPSASASTSSAPSDAGGSGTSCNSTEFGFGGCTVMARKGKSLGMSAAQGMTRVRRKSSCVLLCAPQNQIVPVHHFGAALDAEDRQHVRRRLAADFLGIVGIMSDEPAADLVTVRP